MCSLEGQLSVQDALAGVVGQSYEEPCEDEKEVIRKEVRLYLGGQLEHIEVGAGALVGLCGLVMAVRDFVRWWKVCWWSSCWISFKLRGKVL